MAQDHLLGPDLDTQNIFLAGTEEAGIPLQRIESATFPGSVYRETDLTKWSLSAAGLHLFLPTNLLRSRTRCQFRIARSLQWVLRGVFFFVVVSVFNAVLWSSYSDPPSNYKWLSQQVFASSHHGRGNVKNEKIFIAANIINEDLIRGSWGASLHELIDLLGNDNVFVSIYENDSGTGTGAALRALQQKMNCNSSIVTGAHLPLSNLPKLHLPDGQERVQRVAYLSEVRNQLLLPLHSAYASSNQADGFRSASDLHFDRILFLNDVYFNPLDALQLLFSTNQGDYRAACAMDFIHGPLYYDTFATRDYEGYQMGLVLYPWFAPVGNSVSRNDVRSQTDAVRVRSCWGGMAAFDASPFQLSRLPKRQNCQTTDTSCLPLHFRGSNEAFWETSECCLIFADIENREGKSEKVFMNPYVRVAYHKWNFVLIPYFQRFERFFELIQFLSSKAFYPNDNQRRTHEPGEWVEELVWQDEIDSGLSPSAEQGHLRSDLNELDVGDNSRLGQWTTVDRKARAGGFCGQRNMFVMKPNLGDINEHLKESARNWDKIPVPPIGKKD